MSELNEDSIGYLLKLPDCLSSGHDILPIVEWRSGSFKAQGS